MTELDDVNIRHIKLATGDELIAIVLSDEEIGEESELLMVQRPMMIQFKMDPDGISFVFYEWQPLSKDDTCFINPFHIVSHVECSNSIKEQYINVCLNSSDDHYEYDEDDEYNDELPIHLPSDRTLH